MASNFQNVLSGILESMELERRRRMDQHKIIDDENRLNLEKGRLMQLDDSQAAARAQDADQYKQTLDFNKQRFDAEEAARRRKEEIDAILGVSRGELKPAAYTPTGNPDETGQPTLAKPQGTFDLAGQLFAPVTPVERMENENKAKLDALANRSKFISQLVKEQGLFAGDPDRATEWTNEVTFGIPVRPETVDQTLAEAYKTVYSPNTSEEKRAAARKLITEVMRYQLSLRQMSSFGTQYRAGQDAEATAMQNAIMQQARAMAPNFDQLPVAAQRETFERARMIVGASGKFSANAFDKAGGGANLVPPPPPETLQQIIEKALIPKIKKQFEKQNK